MVNMLRLPIRAFSSLPQLPKTSFEPGPYQGPTAEEISFIRQSNVTPILKPLYQKPLMLHQGHMQWLYDNKGKRYLDMFGGICTVSVGHCHPKITEAVINQFNKLGHVSSLYHHPKLFEYSKRLAEKMPGDLKVVYLLNSGSEANDLAILLARLYTGHTEILSLKNCYHGMSYQTMGLTSVGHYKYSVAPPTGFHTVMNPDVFRGPWGGSKCRDSPSQTSRECSCESEECKAGHEYISVLKNEFRSVVPAGKLAAFFAESIQGVGGTVQFPENYIKEAYRIVKENNGLFISDEVQTGFGRTGEHFWGFEGHGIIPDVVTMAKGIGNGFPLAAVVTTKEISEALTKAAHFNTFGGGPIASTIGLAVLDIIEEEKLQENSLSVGTYLLTELAKMKERTPYIGDVRGKGLMIGVEMVENNKNLTSIAPGKFSIFLEKCKDMGLLVGAGGYDKNVVRIKPPMCITREDADFTLSVMEKALKYID
ncbi:alanine--glyoxylate aminotransferase 2, mitochondrial [Coccinella septempunctata]|uniref:alanine--glyoxylate aminotransferase 2, mitochondrial n=1 Tax=Coccinella septempunctata TaxID=41139 RepID=UPI001D06C550|nr:alanine--glyoxylate aminotransferase 2, mitochondrial [Coccinella septempunctata]